MAWTVTTEMYTELNIYIHIIKIEPFSLGSHENADDGAAAAARLKDLLVWFF